MPGECVSDLGDVEIKRKMVQVHSGKRGGKMMMKIFHEVKRRGAFESDGSRNGLTRS
jgi:hypothetical protein